MFEHERIIYKTLDFSTKENNKQILIPVKYLYEVRNGFFEMHKSQIISS